LVCSAVPAAAEPAAPLLVPRPGDLALYERLCFQVEDSFDSLRNGFVDKNGVPSESATDLAFLLGRRQGGETWSTRGVSTVERMLAFEDTLLGGFHSVVNGVPGQAEIERPTITNMRRLENLLQAWAATGETRYWVAAVRVLEFVERSVVDGRGGFVANPVGDTEVIPEVNGVAIRALLTWWSVGRDARHRDFALKSLDRVLQTCWTDSIGYVRKDDFGDPVDWPLLCDQVEMGRALVLSAHLVGRDQDLERARTVADLMIRHFEDAKRGGFVERVTAKQGKISRTAGRSFRENARATLFLCELAYVTGETHYLEVARRTWPAFEKSFRKHQTATADWAIAMDASLGPVFPEPPAERSGEPRKAPNEQRNRSRSPAAKMGASGAK
jgi:uncharacterized protein YyaL (SSP411 family)